MSKRSSPSSRPSRHVEYQNKKYGVICMKSTNGKLGSVAVTLERGQVNALLQTLNCISVTDTENQYAKDAAKLKDKIIKHGRTFTHKEADSVSLYFYENEASSLIRLLSLFLFSAEDISTDYFPQIGRIHKKGLGISK